MSRDYSNADDTFWNADPGQQLDRRPGPQRRDLERRGPDLHHEPGAADRRPASTTGGVYFAFPDTTIAPFSQRGERPGTARPLHDRQRPLPDHHRRPLRARRRARPTCSCPA